MKNQTITDANGTQNIDGQCTVKVVEGVSQVLRTVEDHMRDKEGVQNANIEGQLFKSLDMNSSSFCSSNYSLQEYNLILGPLSASSYINVTWVKGKATETEKVSHQNYLKEILGPPKFINRTFNSVIANFTVNMT